MADGAHTRHMALQEIIASLESSWTKIFSQASWNSQIHNQEFNSSPSNTITVYPEPSKETMKNIEPETMKKYDPFIEPLKDDSALQVVGSVSDVLLVHKVDSHVKEVEELPQKSTSGTGENIAHQLFDEKPVRVTNKEKHTKHLKGWKFKFKPTSKRSKWMDDMFSFVEETAWLNKDPKETIWDCIKKEFKETMAACGNKITDRFKLVVETLKPAVYDGTIQIRVWDCGGSPLEYGDESPDDEKPDEVTVEGISNKPVNMIQDGESNSDNESRSEVSVSQFQVPLSSMEPSLRCHNHYESLDVADKDMCDESVCDKDGDYILTESAKFCAIYEDPGFELVCLKQSHDPVENHLDNIESALTRSSLRHAPTYQYRAPFNPYQNCSDQSHYKREFGNFTGPGIEFDRASEEVEDDELQDKQPEDEVFGVDVETLVMNEDEKPLECDDEKNAVTSSILCDYNMVCDRKAVLETEKKIEVSDDDEIVSLHKESNLVIVEEIVVASVLKFPTTFTCMRVLGHYKIRKTYILIDPGDATSGNNIQTGHKCGDLENWSLRLEDDFYKIKNQQQLVNNRKVILRLVIPVIVERAVKRRKDYDGALLAPLDDTVAFFGLDVKQLCKQQLDTLLKLVLMIVVPFSILILMTCKVLELIKEKASKKRKLCKNWWFKYKLNTWLSEAFHFWKYNKQINQGGLSASGFKMETWTVKKSLEWLNKLTIAISLAQMFLDHICKLQNTPQDMLSDRDPTFLTVRVLRADLSSDTTYEFIFGQPHPVHFPFGLEETSFAVVMDRSFQTKEELIAMSTVHLSRGLVQWKEHPPD